VKRLLAISWEMPPLSGPRAVQVSRTLRHLSAHGWASTVVCFGPRSTRYNQDFRIDLERLTSGAVEVLRVPSPEEWFVVRALWRICPPIKHLPDEKRVWIRRAVAAARAAGSTRSFSALMSFGQPWSDHLIGLRLRRELALPWVAHFSDPWVDSPYERSFAWQRRLAVRMEHDVIAGADRIVFQNRQTAAHTMSKYPAAWMHKVSIIPQGFEPEPAVRPTTAPVGRGPLRMVYTGRFYPGIRTPDRVLDALAQLKRAQPLQGRLRVDFFGYPFSRHSKRANDLGLASIVAFHGRVPPPEALDAARSADILLVIDAPSAGPSLFLPSKLIDYLPLAKPIVGITPIEGASAELLRSLGYPVVAPDDLNGIASAIGSAVDRWERGTLVVSSTHHSVSAAYDIRVTARQTADVLDGLLAASAGAA
jgi:glycosyltransferase involved in cell wall biosynthesis